MKNLDPVFSRSDAVANLKEIVQGLIADVGFEDRWRKLLTEFEQWEFGPIGQNTSRLNVRLEFMRQVQTCFATVQFCRQPAFVECLLAGSGAKSVGDIVNGPQPDRKNGLLRVMRREITDHYGILYTLETQEGFQFTREFFD